MERITGILAAPFVALRVPPNALTVLGGVLVLIPAAFAAKGDHLLAGISLFVVSGFDAVDGVVARATDRVSAFGGYLDSFVDRIADGVILIGIGMGVTGRMWWPVIGAGLIGQYLTSYARARAYQDAQPPPETWRQVFERPERILFLAIVLVGQGAMNRMEVASWPAEVMGVPRETVVLFWGLLLYAVAANLTALVRIRKVRVFLEQTHK